ncbi:MAG: archaellin/type IV pilin N-terminal domain-containing protein [Methanomassiliicoccus sp.]|nr:archaellin/type IV pilin N-terminal domain-containing protein [Methanomassiliicoccus sp.]
MKHDTRGEMGVGTMIIFIAAVLVAAVAASVLISTANVVREQATQTGNDATSSVSIGFVTDSVYGVVSHGKLTELQVFLKLGPGSSAVNLDHVVASVTISDGAFSTSMDVPSDSTNTVVYDDRIKMTFSDLSAGPDSQISIMIIPSVGYSNVIDLTLPDVLMDGIIQLR